MGEGALGLAKTMWDPTTPRRAWPRGIKAKLLAGSMGLYGERLLGMSVGGNEMVFGQMTGVYTGATPIVEIADGIGFRRFLRTTSGAPARDYWRWGLMPIHGYLDPTGPGLGQALVAQDLCKVVLGSVTTGTVTFIFGWWNTNTLLDPTSFVGVAWFGDLATGTWWARVADGLGTPSNLLHSFNSGRSVYALSRLAIILNGNAKTVEFYMNGELVSTFSPISALGQFSTEGAYFGYCMITGTAASSGSWQLFGGGNPRLLSLVEV